MYWSGATMSDVLYKSSNDGVYSCNVIVIAKKTAGALCRIWQILVAVFTPVK